MSYIYAFLLIGFAVGVVITIKDIFREYFRRKQRRQNNSSERRSSVTRQVTPTVVQQVHRELVVQTAPSATNNSTASSNNRIYYYANWNTSLSDRTFCFSYEKENGYWRAYIVRMPSLQSRDPSMGLTHRLRADDGRTYVCWDTPIKELKDMITVSQMWADLICKYIATGQTFG